MRYFVYIMSNKPRGTLYIGVTNNLIRRVYEHKNDIRDGFTKRYHLKKLVFYEGTDDIISAIQREKNLKRWIRSWKTDLIEKRILGGGIYGMILVGEGWYFPGSPPSRE